MGKSPAFRFYPSDFWGSPDVQAMDLHEVGAYLSLLSNAWLSDRPGHLPDDNEKLRRWARMSREQWTASSEVLLAKFPIIEDGWRSNPRMVLEAEKQASFSKSQSEKGKLGGRGHKANQKPGLSEEKPGLSSGISPAKPSVSVSASASASHKEISKTSSSHPDTSGSAVPQEAIYDEFPRREGRKVALKAIVNAHKRLVKGESPHAPMQARDAYVFLLMAVRDYRKSPVGSQADKQHIPHPATWFNQSRYLDDRAMWQIVGEPPGKRATTVIPVFTNALERQRLREMGASA